MSQLAAGGDLLSLESITRSFGVVRALDGASLHVRAGTVHALLGENGAGKSTLMRIVFGMLSADAGVMRWQGAPMRFRSPADALRHGIGMVHQHFTLVGAMTVAENVALGGRGFFHPNVSTARVREVATNAGLSLDPTARVDSLPVGAQQRCEIVKALARNTRLLILDEPTAVLAPEEARELLAWVRRFADAGNAVVLITHKLRDALSTADDITVLHRGRTVLTTRAADTSESALAEAMLGARGDQDVAATPASASTSANKDQRTVLALQHVQWRDDRGVHRVRDASITVRAGEIVGIAAVEGAGQYEVLRLLAGRLAPQQGTVTRPDSVGFVPEDRHRDAVMLDAPLFENVALRGAGTRRGRMDWSAWRARTNAVLRAFDVRAPGANTRARMLSGGNQQKFVLGRELSDSPHALIVENPSRGLDFRATTAVQQALRAARDNGAAVLMYSSDLDEVLALANRVYAMHDGVLHEVPMDRESVGRAMLGGNTAVSQL
ncbi:MAG: ABC transporter ATP-binding protein [Gemmatimonadaceae bacterium]|nr:ABC transporter ATP-binding protein [Gemmatimonadaceae bacterium]